MAIQRSQEKGAIRTERQDAPGRAAGNMDGQLRDIQLQAKESREGMREMPQTILCPVCGKKLGERTRSRIDVRHKGREISFVPAQKSTVKLRCDNKKCKTLYCFSIEGLDKSTIENP